MWNNLLSSLSLIDISGLAIIAVIVLTFIAAAVTSRSTGRMYARIERDLRVRREPGEPYQHKILNRIFQDAMEKIDTSDEPDFQALIEHHFHLELKGAFVAERFLKSASGLLIVLGLVGTFYGLTLSIGKLVTLITGDVADAAQITAQLTTGLTGALSGMSVAFSTSLFGIVAAILVMLIGVFSDLTNRRNALMVLLEVRLDELCQSQKAKSGAKAGAELAASERTVTAVESLSDSIRTLKEAMASFESSLAGFSENTRDFGEMNRHLKDNIQRMSLGFADFSDSLKERVAALGSERAPLKSEKAR